MTPYKRANFWWYFRRPFFNLWQKLAIADKPGTIVGNLFFFTFFGYRASNVAMAPSMVESYLNQGIGPIPGVSHKSTLFRNKKFALNKMFQQNASKFAIFDVL